MDNHHDHHQGHHCQRHNHSHDDLAQKNKVHFE